MTTNPPSLLAVRTLLMGPFGLAPDAPGIKGDAPHVAEGDSYHLGKPEQNPSGKYSVLESPRDKAGLDEHASASDIGYWSKTVKGKRHDLRTFSIWLVAQCKANTPDTRDIREVIYSPDGKTVKRWDRLGRRTTGDASHLEHTHISWFRDAIKAGRDVTPVFRRYLIEIGLLAGEDDDVSLDDKIPGTGYDQRTAKLILMDLENLRGYLVGASELPANARPPAGSPLAKLVDAANRPAVALTDADRAAIADQVAAKLGDTIADRVADKLAARLES